METSGFIYVASKNPKYYGYAVNSCASLKQFFPEVNVTLFTHSEWVDEHADIFDNVVTGIPAHVRAKMWCMARTPYDVTVYVDADSLVQHRTVKNILTLLDNNHFAYIKPTPEHAVNPDWSYIDKEKTIPPFLDGSFLLYRKTDEVVEFLQDWYDNYLLQTKEEWNHDFAHSNWKQFDMFTIWAMLCSDPIRHASAYRPEFEKYRNLKKKEISMQYNSAWFADKKRLTRPLSIMQIESSAYRTVFYPLYKKVIKICRNKNAINKFN